MASSERDASMMDEEEIEKLPNLSLTYMRFMYQTAESDQEKKSIEDEIMQIVKKDGMATYYETLCDQLGWKLDTSLLETMKKANEEKLKALEEKHKDAVENLGDIEVLDALRLKAKLYSRIGDKTLALEAFKATEEKPQSINQKLTSVLHVIRIGLFHDDLELVKENIEKAKNLLEQGGDWDRRNRLKVYEACYLLLIRDLKNAGQLLLECVATFSCTELFPFKQMIFYTVIASMLFLDRVTLKKKVVDSPEILAGIQDTTNLHKFLDALYYCNYRSFFEALVELHEVIRRDRYLAGHKNFIIREFRVLAYSQFLESYRSVTMQSMATTFGVSLEFLDKELARFISAGRLNAKIDKVDGVIETNRPDAKNALYQEVIKQGDLVLNRVQKLARLVNV